MRKYNPYRSAMELLDTYMDTKKKEAAIGQPLTL